MVNKLLIHANINLNIVDGETIWFSNIINIFIQGGIEIIYISNYKIINDSNLRNIENKSKFNLINPIKKLNPMETLKKIEEYGNKVKAIILRSNLILNIINENWNLLNKTIIYGLDIHLNNIKKLNNKFKKVWTSSEKLKKLFETNEINKINIVPIVSYKYDFNLPKRSDNEIRLIYTGTLRQNENIIEIIEEFQRMHNEHPEVVLKIVYGKINGNSKFINKINNYINNPIKGITFKYNLSHKDTCYEIATSNIGICFHKNGQFSTKLKEYQLYGLKNAEYNNINNNIINIINNNNNKILSVLDRYIKGKLEKYTDILNNKLNCDTMIFESSIKNHVKINTDNYKNYQIILWQNTLNKIPPKKINQKYIYIFHNQCDWSNKEIKNNLIENNNLIDKYIFVSDNIKKSFEKNILIPINSYVIEYQLDKIENDKKEIKGLFVSCGSYNELNGHFELINEFIKLDKNPNKLEIYGNITDIEYYNKLKKYIDENDLFNINLFEYSDSYFDRLKESEYFCLFSKDEEYSYSILEAIALNKKIICTKECVSFSQIEWYPNKIIHNLNNSLYDWFSINNNDFIPYKNNINCLKNIIYENNKSKIGKYIVNNIEDVLNDLKSKKNINKKNGYSFLIRIKNEEETIKKCILDIVDIADEIIVVDNNSTDKTLSIILELEKMYDNIFVYQYHINVPRYGIEHIENNRKIDINKNNTLTNYYNWTESKSTYDKKIKWDGDFYCIRQNLINLLNKYRNYNQDKIAIWFSGLTLFIHNDDKFIKNESYYNEYRLFLNNETDIWSNNIVDDKNYGETSYHFSIKCKINEYFLEPVFIEIKNTSKDEFASKSFLDIDDKRDNIDYNILYSLANNISNNNITKINEIYDIYQYYNLFSKNNNIYINYENRNKIEYDDFLFFKKKEFILLSIDSFGWAFDNISQKIKKYCENNNKIVKIATYPELSSKINNNYSKEKYRENYEYCNIDLDIIDHVIFFWYSGSNIDILKYIENKKNIKSINLAIYDYSVWINNNNKYDEKIFFNNINYFFEKIHNFFYACPKIYELINENIINNKNIKGYPCYDGVDSTLFKYYGYEQNIYTKEKLIIGWIGNSDPATHGINKGFQIIKKIIDKNNDKYEFNPQDSYTKNKIKHSEIPEYIKNIDIIVCFSIAEGTPNQILEASSCGKCWISTKVGIVEELYYTINDNPTGILIERNEEELESALLHLYNNRNLIVNYGQNGRKAIEMDWDWSIKSLQILKATE
jgi:hypothetical protein